MADHLDQTIVARMLARFAGSEKPTFAQFMDVARTLSQELTKETFARAVLSEATGEGLVAAIEDVTNRHVSGWTKLLSEFSPEGDFLIVPIENVIWSAATDILDAMTLSNFEAGSA